MKNKQLIRSHSRQLAGILALSVLVIAFVVAGFFWSFMRSDVFRLAETAIRLSPEIKSATGDIVGYRLGWPFRIDISGDHGIGDMTIIADGSRGKVKVLLSLSKDQGKWRVVSGVFEDQDGLGRPMTVPDLDEQKDRRGRKKKSLEEKSASLQPEGVLPREEGMTGNDRLAAGHRFFVRNEFDQAIIEYNGIIQDDPRRDDAYYWRGRALINLNMGDAAAVDLQKVIELNPRHADAHNWLGWFYTHKGLYDDAIRHLSRAILLNPKNGWAHYHRAECYFRKQEIGKAMLDAEKSCKLQYKNGCLINEMLLRNTAVR